MGLRENDNCWRCGGQTATFLHMAWHCPKIQTFWEKVFIIFHEIIGQPTTPDPLVGLLSYVKTTPVKTRKLYAKLLLFAKHCVAKHWGRKGTPSIREWLRDVTFGHTQLSIFWELMPPRSRPKDIWEPFIAWAQEKQGQDVDSAPLTAQDPPTGTIAEVGGTV